MTVVGRSNVVGKPAALLLLRENATVTICHSKTADLARHTRDAEVVVVAAGVPGLITGEMLSPGAVVVDVGINVVGDKLVGDVDFDRRARSCRRSRPVPGGVGPVTNALLLTHLVRAAQAQATNGRGPGVAPARRESPMTSTAPFPSDLDIARAVTPRPILDVAHELGLRDDEVELYGIDQGQGHARGDPPGRGGRTPAASTSWSRRSPRRRWARASRRRPSGSPRASTASAAAPP